MEIRNSSIQRNITRSGSSQSHIAEQTVTGLIPGRYKVLIFDWERDGSVASVPSYMGNVNVTEHTIFTTSFPQTTTGIPVDVSNQPVQPQPSPDYITGIGAGLGSAVFLLTITVILIIIVVHKKRKAPQLV